MECFENFTTKKSNTDEFIKKAIKIHGDKYDYSLVDYKNNNTKVKIICPIHGVFEQIPRSHLIGINCYKCGKGSMSKEQFIEKSIKKYDDLYDYSNVLTEIENTKPVDIICKKHGVFTTTPSRFLKGIGCSKCAGNRKFTTEEFVELSKQKYSDYDYNYNKTIYNGYYNKCIITCKKHGDFFVIPSLHLNGKSHCNRCSDRKVWDFKYFSDYGNKVHNNKYIYDEESFVNSTTRCKIICKKHGIFYQIPDAHIRGNGCPICRESKGENRISIFLTDNSINYIKNKKFDDCKYVHKLLFDFYLPELNICIEFDGIQHFEPRDKFGGINEFEKIKIRDRIKDEFCDKNNIKLIRISNIDDIEEKLNFLKNV